MHIQLQAKRYPDMKHSKSLSLTKQRILELCNEVNLDVVDLRMSVEEITCLTSIEDTQASSLSYLVSAKTLLRYLNKIKGTVLLSSELIDVVDLSEVPFDYVVVNDPK
jgi:hypothetical protein